jgi:F0F1-type ATP synthase assembly protein I
MLVTGKAVAALPHSKAWTFGPRGGHMVGRPKKQANLWAQVGLYTSLGFILPAGAVVGIAVGWLLDRWLGTSPVLTVLLGFLGAAAGLIEILRILGRAEKDANGNH